MSKKYLNLRTEGPRLRVLPTIIWWLFLDRLEAPGYVYGIVFTILAIATVWDVYRILTEQATDVFEELDSLDHRVYTLEQRN